MERISFICVDWDCATVPEEVQEVLGVVARQLVSLGWLVPTTFRFEHGRYEGRKGTIRRVDHGPIAAVSGVGFYTEIDWEGVEVQKVEFLLVGDVSTDGIDTEDLVTWSPGPPPLNMPERVSDHPPEHWGRSISFWNIR